MLMTAPICVVDEGLNLIFNGLHRPDIEVLFKNPGNDRVSR
jgi:hypothetical protein